MKRFAACLLAFLAALSLILSGCTQSSYTTILSSSHVAEQVRGTVKGRFHGADDDYVSESRFGSDYEKLSSLCYDYMILLSDDEETNIDQIGVFHVINSKDVDDIASMIRSYVEAETLRLRDLLTSYNPAELPKLEQAQVKVCGTYVLYTFLSESDTAAAIDGFEKALKA